MNEKINYWPKPVHPKNSSKWKDENGIMRIFKNDRWIIIG